MTRVDYDVRAATEADAAAICQIYNQGIEDRLATLETELRTPDERRHWLAARSPRHPVIVAEMAGRSGMSDPATAGRPGVPDPTPSSARPPTSLPDLAGPATTVIAWGSLNVFNAREAYRYVADISVYVERAWRGKGAGRVVLARLIELGVEHGFHKLVLSAFPFNRAGVALYERLGFRTVGIYKEQGLLDGTWVDTIIMERLL
jgi:L-amino acid N-acyltransferase YncA